MLPFVASILKHAIWEKERELLFINTFVSNEFSESHEIGLKRMSSFR